MKGVSLNSWPCQARSMLVDTNSNWALFYSFTVSVNKCGGSCKTIDDPYGWVCVPHKVQKNESKSI